MQAIMAMLGELPSEVLWDGIQVVLCGVIFAGMLRQRRNFRRRLEELSTSQPPTCFSQEVLLQTLRQQTQQVLNAISAAVEAERSKLQPLLDAGQAEPLRPKSGSTPEPVVFPLSPEMIQADTELEGARSEDIHDLAARGLSARRIAERMRQPVGEVELALQLQRARL